MVLIRFEDGMEDTRGQEPGALLALSPAGRRPWARLWEALLLERVGVAARVFRGSGRAWDRPARTQRTVFRPPLEAWGCREPVLEKQRAFVGPLPVVLRGHPWERPCGAWGLAPPPPEQGVAPRAGRGLSKGRGPRAGRGPRSGAWPRSRAWPQSRAWPRRRAWPPEWDVAPGAGRGPSGHFTLFPLFRKMVSI